MTKKVKIKVKAILDTELENMLKQTNQYGKIIAGEIHCQNCDTVITVQNIGIIIPKLINNENILEFYCERIDCTELYIKKS